MHFNTKKYKKKLIRESKKTTEPKKNNWKMEQEPKAREGEQPPKQEAQLKWCHGCYPTYQPNQVAHMGDSGCLCFPQEEETVIPEPEMKRTRSK